MEKNIIFVETNPTFSEGAEFARTMGYSPILFTRINEFNPSYYTKSELNAFDDIYDIDTHSAEAMLGAIKKYDLQIKGVMSCFDDTILPAAYLAEELSLPHPAITGLQNTYYKDNVRNILSHKGVAQLKHAVIDLNNTPQQPPLSYPFVLKPAHDCGADGVYLCKSLKDYQAAIENVKAKRFTFSGLERDKILLEEFIAGVFYGAEFLWQQNSWCLLGVNKLFVDHEKSLCMTGISFPADIPKNILKDIEQELLKWINCLELKGGALNIEFKLVNNRPVLIEINPRLAGSKVNKLIELSLGISPIQCLLQQNCNVESNFGDTVKNHRLHFANAFIFPKKSGKIKSFNTFEIPKMHLIQLDFKTPPFFIQNDQQIFDNIIGHVIASGVDCDSAMANAQEIVNKIKDQ